MAKYRVWAKMTTYCYLDVEAEDEEQAKDVAEETDGGDFTADDMQGDWEIEDDVDLLDDNVDVDVVAGEDDDYEEEDEDEE